MCVWHHKQGEVRQTPNMCSICVCLCACNKHMHVHAFIIRHDLALAGSVQNSVTHAELHVISSFYTSFYTLNSSDVCNLPVILSYRCGCGKISMGVWSSPVKHYWLLLLISGFLHIHFHTQPSYYYLTKTLFCGSMATRLSVKPTPLHASYQWSSGQNPRHSDFNNKVLCVDLSSFNILYRFMCGVKIHSIHYNGCALFLCENMHTENVLKIPLCSEGKYGLLVLFCPCVHK